MLTGMVIDDPHRGFLVHAPDGLSALRVHINRLLHDAARQFIDASERQTASVQHQEIAQVAIQIARQHRDCFREELASS